MTTSTLPSPLPEHIDQAAFDDLWETTDRLIRESREQRGGFTVAKLIGACKMGHNWDVAEAFLRARSDLLPSEERVGLVFKAGC